MLLKVENIEKSFGKKVVLRDVSFNMEAGTLYGIVGENGSGKSTLLKIIVGQWKPNRGNVIIDGGVGYCPQEPLIFSQLTVEEHFQYFAAAYGLVKEDWKPQFNRLLEHFNFERFRMEKVSELSGGTRQKLNLSLALLHKPKLLILDEPYNGFDWDTYLRFWEFTGQMQASGSAILIVTHLLTETDRFDRVFDLKKGVLE